MAIPQGRLSTTPILGSYLPPEGTRKHPITSFEAGPIAVEDTSEGLQYQTWAMTWNVNTGYFSLEPDTGPIVPDIHQATNVTFASFTFDQSARTTLAYTNDISSYLVWYDTEVAQYVTTDIGVGVISPFIYLDDKRQTQNVVNDMLLWYTKEDGGGAYNLYMKKQRERFLIEQEMATGINANFIIALGMTDELRIQIRLKSLVPTITPPTNDPDNLDFESGDTNWTQETGVDFVINQNMPQTGTWNLTLDTISTNSSRFVNDTFFPVIGSQEVTIGMSTIGTVAAGLAFGYQYYDASFVYLGRTELTANVTGVWETQEWVTNVPVTAAHIKLCVSSNGFTGVFHIDNFTLLS